MIVEVSQTICNSKEKWENFRISWCVHQTSGESRGFYNPKMVVDLWTQDQGRERLYPIHWSVYYESGRTQERSRYFLGIVREWKLKGNDCVLVFI